MTWSYTDEDSFDQKDPSDQSFGEATMNEITSVNHVLSVNIRAIRGQKIHAFVDIPSAQGWGLLFR